MRAARWKSRWRSRCRRPCGVGRGLVSPDREDVAGGQLTSPCDDLVAEDLLREPSEAWVPQPKLDATALSVRLGPDGNAWAAADADTGRPAPVLATVGPLAPETQTGDPFTKAAGSNVGRMVELRGLEPLTFALPARRSPS